MTVKLFYAMFTYLGNPWVELEAVPAMRISPHSWWSTGQFQEEMAVATAPRTRPLRCPEDSYSECSLLRELSQLEKGLPLRSFHCPLTNSDVVSELK